MRWSPRWDSFGFPLWLSGKESTCQCRTHRFDLWSRKIPHATEQQSQCTTIEPVLYNPGTTTTEAYTLQLDSSPCSLQLDQSLCSNEQPARLKIKKERGAVSAHISEPGRVSPSHYCLGSMGICSPAGSLARGLPKKREAAGDLISVPKVAAAYRQTRHPRQHILLWHFHVIHNNHPCG